MEAALRIGVCGVGMVGGTVKFGLERLGHELICYDPYKSAYHRNFGWMTGSTELIFVCVPTPSNPDGSCNVSIVEQAVRDIAATQYNGVIAIKSTVGPGTTDALIRELFATKIAFCPEFLRERTAVSDFCDHHEVCIIGACSDHDFDVVRAAHGHYPKRFARLSPREAELAKYFSNVFNALRITFANQFYDVCRSQGADYSAVKNAVSLRDGYLECNENLRAYGGNCLPKDVKAFRHFVGANARTDATLWAVIDELNRITEGRAGEAEVA